MKKFYTGLASLVLTAAAGCATTQDIEFERFMDKSMSAETMAWDNGDAQIYVADVGDKPKSEPYKSKYGTINKIVEIGTSSEVPPLYNGLPGDFPPDSEDNGEKPIELNLSE